MANQVLQAIRTEYFGAGNVRGARIKAQAGGGITRWIGWDHALGIEANHRAAAEELARGLGWLDKGETLIQGGMGGGYVFVIAEPDPVKAEMLTALEGILASFHDSVRTDLALSEFPALHAVSLAIAKAKA